jgi:cell division protein FtsW
MVPLAGLPLGRFRFNPGEIARVAMLVFLADLLSRKHEQRNDWKRGIAPALVVIYTLAFGLLLQKRFLQCLPFSRNRVGCTLP